MASESPPAEQTTPPSPPDPIVAAQEAAVPPAKKSARSSASKATGTQSVRVEGLAETLHEVRHELSLLSSAHRYNWINQRLILLRNFIIAMSVIVGVAVVVIMCYREAYRQTLTISAFDVPEKLAERGITGHVVAKALFDELIKRRKTVTTLDAGDLKGAWTENRSDVAVPETKLTFQSVFRYLRHLTGNEIAVDGEMLIDGDNVTIKARVAGNPPRAVKGKLADWEALLGELANYVYETTQPAVLASYLGLNANTPEDLVVLSRHIGRMLNVDPRLPPNVMAVAYDAYGSALMRQDKHVEALAAFDQAISYDPQSGLAVMNAAQANFFLGEFQESSKLYERAVDMKISDAAKSAAFRYRASGAWNRGDCAALEAAIRQAKTFTQYDARRGRWMDASFLTRCAYEEAKGIEMLRAAVSLHPDSSSAWSWLGTVSQWRPGKKYLREAIEASQRAVDLDVGNFSAYLNLAFARAENGQTEQAMAAYNGFKQIRKFDNPRSNFGLAHILYAKGEYQTAESMMQRNIATPKTAVPVHYQLLGMAQDKLGKSDEALSTFRAAQKLFPASCALYDEAGKLLLKQQRTQEAFAEFDRGIAAVKKCGLPYISHARALIEMNRILEARAKLDALIKVSPTSDGAEEAKEILATLGKTG